MEKKPIHLIVRFSDNLFDVGDVVEKHNKSVAAHGAVWFGKLSQTISQTRIDQMNKQIEMKVSTFLYLVKGNRRKSTPYKTDLYFLSKKQQEENLLIPIYCKEKGLLKFMKT